MIAYTREDIRHSVAAAEDVGELRRPRRRCSTRSSTSPRRRSRRLWCRGRRSSRSRSTCLPRTRSRAVVDSPYTRYPVYRGSLDEIVGILHVRDLFAAIHDLGIAAVELESIVRPAYVVPETKDLAALLADFRREKQHMAIVIDEYGDDGGHRHARGPARGDRRRDRGRVRPSGHVHRAHRREPRPHRRDLHDRRLQRGVRAPSSSRRTTTRWPGSCSARSDGRPRSATRFGRRPPAGVLEIEGSRIMKIEVEFGQDDETPSDEPAAA